MNNTDTFKDFAGVVQYNWRVYGRKYITFFAVVMGILAFFIANKMYFNAIENFRYFTVDNLRGDEFYYFMFIFVFSSCALASQMMQPLKNKTSRIQWLMLPASQSTKFLVRWLIVVPCFFLLYVLGYEIIELLRYLYTLVKYPDSGLATFVGFDMLSRNMCMDNCTFLFMAFSLQSFFVLGSVVWPNRALVYTALFLFAMAILIPLWTAFTATLLIDTFGLSSGGFIHLDDDADRFQYSIDLVMGCIMLINYTIAYFRYKEIEIIQRW